MKRVLLIVGPLLLLLVLVAGACFLVIQRFESPDYLVRNIESSYNCRAEVSSAKLRLFSSPATLEIMGLSLAPRDKYADGQVPRSQRPAIQSNATIDYILLELKTAPLLRRKLVVTNFSIERPTIEMTVFEDGSTTIDEMIKPSPAAQAKKQDAPPKPTPKAPDSAGSQGEGFVRASELPFDAIDGRLAIEDATITATIAESNTTVQIHEGILIFSDVDVDPSNLEEHNAANVDLSAWIAVDSFEKDKRYLDLWLDGTGAVQPFSAESGELYPSFTAAVTVRKDSWIDALPVIDDMEELLIEMTDYGVDLEGVRLRGDFSEDTTASFNATRESVKMTSDFMVPIDENFLVLEEGSWVNSGKNDHNFGLTFIGSESLTRKVESEMGKYLAEQMDPSQAKMVQSAIISLLKQSEFLVLRFQSQGDLGDPKVAAITPIGELGNMDGNLNELISNPDKAMDALKDGAEDLIRGIFGR